MRNLLRKLLGKIMSNAVSEYQEEGYDAYHEGFIVEDNPYLISTFPHIEWERGWIKAEQGVNLESE